MAGGRPPKFKSANDFTAKANQYFVDATANSEPVTITGLCLALDTTRDLLADYANGTQGQEFSDAVKRAKMRVENFYEQRLSGNNPTGAIFALKNFGWSDKVQNEVSGPDGGPIQAAITVEFVKTNVNSKGESAVS